MTRASDVTFLLKRGALIAAANWQVVVLQFIADAGFKLLLAVPIIAAAFLVALLVGGSAVDLAAADVDQILAVLLAAFHEHPGAVLVYGCGLAIVLAGGSALTVLVKGGTVATLLAADRRARAIERRPVRLATLARTSFRLERFMTGCGHFFGRYVTLALVLAVCYAVAGTAYLVVVYWSYQLVSGAGALTGWTLAAAAVSGLLVITVTIVNLLYLLMQIVIAHDDCRVRQAGTRVASFLASERATVALLFATLLVAVTLATAASILATAGLGLVAFIPILGLAIFWLQLAAWVARALLFQYLGLTALCAYAHLYRRSTALEERPAAPAPQSSPSAA